MGYSAIDRRLKDGGIVLLDGAIGTELQRRGAKMDPDAWCGPATLENVDVLVDIYRDYIAAGADIITANTYATSRLMLGPTGYADRFEEINKTAVAAAHRAREEPGRADILVAGSLSHMCPHFLATSKTDPSKLPSKDAMADAFGELAALFRDEGCDLILLEMMYDPDRMDLCFAAAVETGLPVWAGFSARRGSDGGVLGARDDRNLAFEDLLPVLEKYPVQAAGVMHSESNVTGEALALLRAVYDGPLTAYPDSGHFKMPDWLFEEVISPEDLHGYAKEWVANGAQVLGGCCGLTADHIKALAALKG